MCRPLSSAILDFTITKYGDDQVHDFIGFLDPQNLAKDTKIISLVHFLESYGWFYATATILDAILNFTPSARDPDCPPKFILLYLPRRVLLRSTDCTLGFT